MKRTCLTLWVALFTLGLAASPSPGQQWAPGGVPLCKNGCPGDVPQVVPDGLGGAFVAWRDVRNSDDVFLQHITGVGLIAPGWPDDGLPMIVDPSVQELSGLAPDGLGGALVAWEDWRDLSPTGEDPEVQRVLANGSLAPGWPSGGVRVSAPRFQCGPQVVPDGLGGAYVAWADCRDVTPHIYGQHLTASGSVAAGWPGDGVPICTAPGAQLDPAVFPDDSGGVVVAWVDARGGTYAQRLRADGTIATGWIANGIPIELGQILRAATRDEAGGFYVVSTIGTTTPLGDDSTYTAYRYTFGGVLAPGWSAGGVQVCVAPGARSWVQVDGDGSGGVLLSWVDFRSMGAGQYSSRILSDGSLAPGWSADGTFVSARSGETRGIVPDGQGGAYTVTQTPPNAVTVSIWHLNAQGRPAPGWPMDGLPLLGTSGDQFNARIAADGQGGAIVVWDEACCGRIGVWAQRFGPVGPTPVLVALVSAEVKDGGVQLDWFSQDAAALSASVYRRTENSDWQSLGGVVGDGTGDVRYEDSAVTAGVRYAYRLGYVEQGLEHFTAETWVRIPALNLALQGLQPNQAAGELVASFTLPSGAPARLQLLDVTGRVWLTREVGSMGAGNHLLGLGRGGSVPAGMYWLRLTQSGRSLLARGGVVR